MKKKIIKKKTKTVEPRLFKVTINQLSGDKSYQYGMFSISMEIDESKLAEILNAFKLPPLEK